MTVPTPFWALFLLATAAVLLTIALFAVRDILRRRHLDRVIRDGLTGSYSSDFIREIYEAELRRAARTGVPFSLAFVTLHERKDGPVAGAQIAMAKWLRRSVRSSDYVARLGERQFVLIFPETWEEDAADLLRRIDTSMRYSPSGNGKEITLTWDIGAATWSPEQPEVWEAARQRQHARSDAPAGLGMSPGVS